jgi:hypothetical protein
MPKHKFRITNRSVIIWTGKIKSLLPSLYKREELPLFGKEGQGRFSEACVFFGIRDLKFL